MRGFADTVGEVIAQGAGLALVISLMVFAACLRIVAAPSAEAKSTTSVSNMGLANAVMNLREKCPECPVFIVPSKRSADVNFGVATTEITFRQYKSAMAFAKCPAPIAVRQKSLTGRLDTLLRLDEPSLETNVPVTGINDSHIRCYIKWLNSRMGNTEASLPSVAEFGIFSSPDRKAFLSRIASGGVAFIIPGSRLVDELPILSDDDFLKSRFIPRRTKSSVENDFGLFEVIGNAAEITSDCLAGPAAVRATAKCSWRAVCGGSVAFPPQIRKPGSIDAMIPDFCDRESSDGTGVFQPWIGFRVVIRLRGGKNA